MASGCGNLIGVYERTIRAGIDRIWENVRDWEHLPWLHADAFSAVRLISEDSGGWTADVEFAGGGESRIRVALDQPALRYVTSTLSGAGAGTDIVTELQPQEPGVTDIAVAFHVPGIEPGDRDAVFAAYRDLYRGLWDQDEAMMRERQSFLDDRQPRLETDGERTVIELGDKSELERNLPRTISAGGKSFRLVAVGGDIVAHSLRCPHLGGPLAAAACVDGTVTCPWHGYRFDVRSRQCVSGQGFRLAEAPSVTVDPETRTVAVVISG